MTTIQPPAPPAPATPVAAQPPVDGEVVEAPVVKLPESLGNTTRDITLRGEITNINPDGTIRIATPRGPVDIQLPAGQTATRGQSVEVTIPQGNPPQNLTITLPRTAPLPTAQTLPQTTAQPLPPAPPLPATAAPAAGTATTQQPDTNNTVTPQKLVAFLKSSLDNFIKSATPEMAATLKAGSDVFTQHPLQPGQLARITPLLLGSAQPGTPATLQGPQQAGFTPFAQTQATNTLLANGHTNLAPALAGTTGNTTGTLQTTPLLQGAGQPQPSGSTSTVFGSPAQPAGTTTPFSLNAPAAQGAAQTLWQAPLSSVLPQGITLLQSPFTAQASITTGANLHAGIPQATPQTGVHALPATDLRILEVLPATSGNAAALQSQSVSTLLHGTPTTPTIFTGLLGQTAQGLPVLGIPAFGATIEGAALQPQQTPMVLQYPASGLGASSILKIQLLPQAPALAAATALATPATQQPWAALDETFANLRSEPQGATAAQALTTALPKPGSTAFAAPVLMMAAALRSGDAGQWLGEKTIDALKATAKKGDALARLAGALASSAQDSTDTATKAEWKSQSLPMVFGQELHRIQLHTRSFAHDESQGQQNRKTGTRFVMDLSLSRMGPLQIDGYSVEKRLDVTLRSEQALSPTMREKMRAQYVNALSGIGFSGQLNFSAEATHKGWVTFEGEGQKPYAATQA